MSLFTRLKESEFQNSEFEKYRFKNTGTLMINQNDGTVVFNLSKDKKVEEEPTKVNLNQDNANKEQETTTVVADKPAETVQEVDTEVPSGESTVQN